ncbi:hypothetical protein ACFQZZ_06600 [Nocardia sp. GCM10030253]|uniref:hypothetical protein n=1 Tax=Nocardia sp. GCM10030253 TaxID=3273404 RepID=UPI0036451ABB
MMGQAYLRRQQPYQLGRHRPAADSKASFYTGGSVTVVVVFLDDEGEPLEDSRQTAQLTLTRNGALRPDRE